ncbi:hypothetical protein ACN27G_11210 [Plantactinospora sp. WMMB334]|uniref:hypothetical protein n=1 Tax=Plantactinospora sp. WMMB334 TaxID=3404119 RepID=UPI003B939728
MAAGPCAVAVFAGTGAAVVPRGQGGGPYTVGTEPVGRWQRMVAWGNGWWTRRPGVPSARTPGSSP